MNDSERDVPIIQELDRNHQVVHCRPASFHWTQNTACRQAGAIYNAIDPPPHYDHTESHSKTTAPLRLSDEAKRHDGV
jgi:hypothetical protein